MAAVKVKKRRQPENPSAGSVPSPGKRLQQARQALGMEVATVAEKLHLSKAMVQALEEENHEVLPARVFVRGYYRNYARLVEVSPEVILREFEQRCPEGEDCSVPPTVAKNVRKEIRSNHGLVRLVTWLMVIALISVFGMWLNSYLDKKEIGVQPKDIVQAPMKGPTEQAPVEKDADAGSPVEEAEQTPSLKLPVPQPVAEEPPAPAEAPPAATASREQSSVEAGPPRVVLSFSGDCWVDVRDSTRKFKLVGRRKAGETYELKGKPPYKMVLGNASNVTISIDGKPFDLGPYTKGNVAKLTFNPNKE